MPTLPQNKKAGILISGVIESSPAEKAGILPGDLLTQFNGQKVQAKIPEDLPPFHQLISSLPPGQKVVLSGYGTIKGKPGP